MRNTVEDANDQRIRVNAVDNPSTVHAQGRIAHDGVDVEVCSAPLPTETSDPFSQGITCTQAPIPSGANCYGWDDDSDLSSVPSDFEGEEMSTGHTANHQNPRRRMAKTKQKKLQSWETVDDIRVITDGASMLLQVIAGIGDQSNARRLLSLKDILSGQTQGHDSPETISLALLVKRCEQSELMVAESKFKHMVNLMQLSLWLDQCVYSLYDKCIY